MLCGLREEHTKYTKMLSFIKPPPSTRLNYLEALGSASSGVSGWFRESTKLLIEGWGR